jgi:hypothetical protein
VVANALRLTRHSSRELTLPVAAVPG